MTAPGGTPGLPSGTVLTLDNLQSRLQDMSPAAMKSRAVDWFPAKANSTTGGNPAAGASPFGVLTDIWSRFNATVAAADPAAVNSVSDLDNLFDEFVHNLPVVGKFVELVEAFTGDYEGDDEVLIGIQNLFGTIPKLIGGLLSGSWIPGLDASKIVSGTMLQSRIANLIPDLANRVQSSVFRTAVRKGSNLVADSTLSDTSLDAARLARLAYPNGGAGGTWSHDTTIVRTPGQRSLKFVSAGGATIFPAMYLPPDYDEAWSATDPTQYIPVRAGQRFSVSFWAYTPASNATRLVNGFLYCRNSATGLTLAVAMGGNITLASDTWTQLTGYVQIPAGYDRMLPYLFSLRPTATPGDTAYFQDPEVYEVTESTNLVNRLFGSLNTSIATILAGSVPTLDASKVTTGSFGTSLIPSLPASKITSGSFLETLIPTLTAAKIPTLDASKISGGTLLETLIPTLTTSKIPDLPTSKITSGTFAQSMLSITNIASSIVSGVFGSSQIPTLDASKIQTGTFADGFLPGLGSLVTGFFSALTGNTDPDATKEQTAAQLQELAATTAANASAIAALQSSSDGVTSGMSGGDEFTRVVANGLGTGWETLYYSGTDANGYWRVDGNQAVWVDGGNTPRTSRHIRTDPADMTTLTDYQKTVFVQGTTSSETNAGIRILHRVNAARSEYVICQITDALALFGYTVSGSAGETQFPGASSVATTGAVGVSWTVESGTLLGVRVFRLSRNGNAILSYSDTGNLSAYGPNNRGWGWGGMAVNRNFGQGTPSACTRITIADNVPRAVVAPTARMYRTSTSSYTFPTGWRNITSGFWQFVARHAPDVIEASTALGGFIIKKAGAFAFNVAIRMGSNVSAVLKLALYVNGVMTQVKAASAGGSMKSGEAMTAVFDEYCAPGDVVTVGTWHSGLTGNYILAEATGMETHFTGTATALSFN